jgi:signal transduction histidine kinase/CheY-like chemotaxis protein
VSADDQVRFASHRVTALLNTLERLAGGDTETRLEISARHDELDAIAFGINVVADELRFAHRQMADTLRHSKEQAERANESKGVFLRNASHEIRAPIAVITIITELLSLPNLSDEERADLVTKLRANSQAVLALVGNLLDLSRIEAGKLTTTIEPVAPLQLVTEVVESLEPQARKNGLAVRVDVEGTVPLAIASDQQRLRQILVNVIGNALKFTESGGVRITLSTTAAAQGTLLHVDVADTGPGIPPNAQKYLFEPFEQAAIVPPVHSGTGLGLSIARRLAEQLGGSLALVRSGPEGSMFRLTIGATAAHRTSSDSRVARQGLPRGLNGIRILLVDDNEDLQVALQRLLRSFGATVEVANDGRAAIAQASSRRYDVVLMDILMPGVNGLDAIRTLRAKGCDVPIIALTGDATTARRLASLDAGYSALLAKPFEPDHLVSSISSVLAGHREDIAPAKYRGPVPL